MKGAKASFKVGDVEFPAGSFDHRVGRRIACARKSSRSASSPRRWRRRRRVETVDVDLPRIAMYTTWANTEKVGWVRLAFDRWEIPFDLIHKDHVQAGANLRAKYDVIVMPHQTNNGKAIVYEQPKLSKPLPYKKNDKFKSLGCLRRDRRRARRHGPRGRGGVPEVRRRGRRADDVRRRQLLSRRSSGIAKGVDAQSPAQGLYAPGPYVQSEILLPTHPVMYRLQRRRRCRCARPAVRCCRRGRRPGCRAVRRHRRPIVRRSSRASPAARPAC